MWTMLVDTRFLLNQASELIMTNKIPPKPDFMPQEAWDALMATLTAFFPLWGHFQKYCDREFGVFILSPKK